MTPRPTPSSRLRSIDFLRGAAALGVVLFHAINYGGHPPLHVSWFRVLHVLLGQGGLGVALFFVISGFCIHLRWASQSTATAQRGIDLGEFWARRLRRLYPPYFVMLCISMGIVFAAYLSGRGATLRSLAVYPEPRLNWMAADFVAHALMLHGFHPVFDRAGGNSPFWTLAREEYFYAMYFPLLFWRRSWGVPRTIGVVLLLGITFPFLMRYLLAGDSAWWMVVWFSPLVLWIQWCLGMAAVEAHCGRIELPRWCYAVWMAILWACLARVCELRFQYLAPLLWGLTFFTLLNWCVRREETGTWPANRLVDWVTRVGVFSYSLYLVHLPVRGVAKLLLGRAAETSNPWLYVLCFLVISVACYFAGVFFFRLVERRFLNRRAESVATVSLSATPALHRAGNPTPRPGQPSFGP